METSGDERKNEKGVCVRVRVGGWVEGVFISVMML